VKFTFLTFKNITIYDIFIFNIIKIYVTSIKNNRSRISHSRSFRSWRGIGVVFGALILGVARNPSLKNQLFSYSILGFAFSEATALFALMMSLLLLYFA